MITVMWSWTALEAPETDGSTLLNIPVLPLSVKQALCNCRKMCSLAFSPCGASLEGGEGRAEGKKREWAPLLLVFKTPRGKRWNQTNSSPFAHCKDVPQHLCWLSYRATNKREKLLLLSPSLFFYLKIHPRGEEQTLHIPYSHTMGSQPTAVSSAPLFGQVCLICVLPLPTVTHTVCHSDRNDAVGTSAQEEGTGKSMARESDHSRELLLELLVMVSSTIIIRNTSNKY